MRWITRERLHLYPGALAVGLWLSWVLRVILSEGPRTLWDDRLGGDFPAFWGAGRLVLAGRADELWSLQAQLEAQGPGMPLPDMFVPFPYAPPVALLFAPLGAMPYRLAYAAFTVLMVAATWVAVRGLLRLFPSLLPWRWAVLLGVLGFPPLFRASTNGQSTAVVLCLFVWIFVGVREKRPVLAGLLLGALWFKPTYAAPLTGLLLLDREYRALGTVAAVIAIGWVTSFVMSGVDWFWSWTELAMAVQEGNLDDLRSTVSLVQFTWGAFPDRLGAVLGLTLIGMLALITVLLWRRNQDPRVRIALVGIATLAMAPHAYWYDLGLMIPALAAIAIQRGRASVPLLAVPVLLTLPEIGHIRLGPLWVAMVVFYFAVVARDLVLDGEPASDRASGVAASEGLEERSPDPA